MKISVDIPSIEKSFDVRYVYIWYINGLMQERRNSRADALEFRLSCSNSSIYGVYTT